MKKAQISLGLTWVIGFLIIFFIIILFLSSAFILSQRKKIDISIERYNTEELELQRAMINLLNEEEQGIAIGDSIKQWNVAEGTERAEIKKNLENTIRSKIPVELGCYIFYAADSSQIKADEASEKNELGYGAGPLESKPDAGHSIWIDNNLYSRKTAESSFIYLVSDKGIIKISLYAGDCNKNVNE